MNRYEELKKKREPNCRGLIDNILGKGTPGRVYHMEIFQDEEIKNAIADRFDLMAGIDGGDPDYERKKYITVQRFCGFDYVVVNLVGTALDFIQHAAKDTAELANEEGRQYVDEHKGPITSWEDFEKYQWPDISGPEATSDLEWYQKNLPDDMCIIGGLVGHFLEEITFLMGYETMCFALFEQRDLVKAISDRLVELYRQITGRILQFDRVKIIWGTDDMGFKTSLAISPDDMREFVLPSHKILAQMSHEADRLYFLHSCGKLAEIMDDLIDDVKIDAKHSFEDTIEDVCEVKNTYGRRIAILGGIDVDFLCRSDEQAIRKRIRKTLDICMPGGRYCLGTGNSVANYIPLDNYLTMLDEGMLYGA